MGLFGSKSKGEVSGKVVWDVHYYEDDVKGPGWYISTVKIDDLIGRFRSKSKAVETAFREADEGDVIQIWNREWEPGDEPALEYVH